jgi:endonuclease YncB( thermonuclease family)
VCTPGNPFASTANLKQLIGTRALQCRAIDRDRYGREVAYCSAGGRDLSCAQVVDGFAVPRYGDLDCQRRK